MGLANQRSRTRYTNPNTAEIPPSTRNTHQQMLKSVMYLPKSPLATLLKRAALKFLSVGMQYLLKSINKIKLVLFYKPW